VLRALQAQANARAAADLAVLQQLPDAAVAPILRLLPQSKAQFRQDLFVLAELGFRRDGFFVEFGATDGLNLSNTWLLEKQFGWRGILAEPGQCWHAALSANRRCAIDQRCVWSNSGETLRFNQTAIPELSTIEKFSSADLHKDARKTGSRYDVATVSLMDLLAEHGAPAQIDYLSIDTEGSEFDILESFDFGRYDVRVITCEHNFTPMRRRVHALLSGNGYVRKFETVSEFDDWYVKA
jgi:FkbM family methyltransferase